MELHHGTPLRIAVLSPIAWRTPPRQYGPWELFASLLTEGLVALGHDVTLFATADSETSATLHSSSPRGWSEDATIDAKVAECLHISSVFEQADEFDVIHNSFDFLPLTYSQLVETPVLTTIHGFSSDAIVPVYKKYASSTAYVSISDADRHRDLPYVATIHHGIDCNQYRLSDSPGDELLFFGRIHPDKGTAAAIDVAKRCGRKLTIAGPIHDEQYFQTSVAPHLGHQIQYIGNVERERHSSLLSNAYALLHLIDFDEPFGFSVVEAMACGTPVIAYDRGSMPELITDGVTGFIVQDVESAVDAVGRAAQLDRQQIRASTMARYDSMAMVKQYVAVYRQIVSGASDRQTGSSTTAR
jgi:glycosyltransferase involved in cell wall biosynthesis